METLKTWVSSIAEWMYQSVNGEHVAIALISLMIGCCVGIFVLGIFTSNRREK